MSELDSKTFEMDGKSYELRKPTVKVAKYVERNFARDTDLMRGLALLEKCLYTQVANTGAWRPVNEQEFEQLRMDQVEELQQHFDALNPPEKRRAILTANLLEALDGKAPPEVSEYLLGLLGGKPKEEPDPLA